VRTFCWGEHLNGRGSKRRQALHASYFLPNIMNIIELRKIGWVGHIAHT
jgi:hypothetical protein